MYADKIKKKFGISTDNIYNLLLHSDGTATDAEGVQHFAICEKCGITLDEYLNSGGCRIMILNDQIVFESGRPLTDEQIRRAKRIVRSGDYGYLVVSVHGHTIAKDNFTGITVRDLMFCLGG